MSRSENLLLVLHHLMNRRSVDVRTIQSECSVSERTAFRYVRALETIGFPVYYDPEYQGYRLINKQAKISQFAPVEAAILILALDLIEHSISPNSIDSIKRIRLKLEASIPESDQRSLLAVFNPILADLGEGQTRNQILLTLIDYAQRLGRKVRLIHAPEGKVESAADEILPTLRFDKGWRVEGKNTAGWDASIPISTIRDIEML